MITHEHRFTESESRHWWGRLIDDDGRVPQRHVRLFWNVKTQGDRTRIANVGAALLPYGKMKSGHPAYAHVLRQFESYTHSDGNVKESWLDGKRTAEDVWAMWSRIGFASPEYAARAVSELSHIAEAEWARDPLFDHRDAVRSWFDGPDNPNDSGPTWHGPAPDWKAVESEALALGTRRACIDEFPPAYIHKIGAWVWGQPVSSTRARRMGGQLCGIAEDLVANEIWNRGGVVTHVYECGPHGYTNTWAWGADEKTPRRVDISETFKPCTINTTMSADDPDPVLWDHVPDGFFRNGTRGAN
jgi:hypothetical protein